MVVAQQELTVEDMRGDSVTESVEIRARSEQRTTYCESLSRIGTFLDAAGASHVSVREEGDFTLAYWTAREGHCSIRVSHPGELRVGTPVDVKPRRHPLTFRRREPAGQGQTAHYEPALRALGQELDGLSASRLLLDETEEGFLVTYSYVKASRGVLARKRLVFLHPDSADRVLIGQADPLKGPPRQMAG